MNMIGHDDVSPNSPAMTAVIRSPLVHKNAGCFVLSKNRLSVIDARGDIIEWKIDPNAFESSQMLVHIAFVAERVNLGESQKLPRTSSTRSAPAATT